MAKMYALKIILLPGDKEVPRRSVFEASPALAKQLMDLKSARNATKAEIEAAEAARKAAVGHSGQTIGHGDGEVIATDIAPTAKAKAKT